MTTHGARPFIKWAGGKTQLLPALGGLFPAKFRTYFEPFLGGGAVFWHIAGSQRFEKAVLNDFNQELIDTYTVVRDYPVQLVAALNEHMRQAWNTQEYFTEMRKLRPEDLDIIPRAARIIYLNKTCFNGLYRVNKSGGFNAPFGRYANPKLFEGSNIKKCSALLNKQKVLLLTGDFNRVPAMQMDGDDGAFAHEAGPGDVVYFDPPYVPVSATANFLSYTSDGFTSVDQDRLAICFRNLAKKDVSCILSNSDTPVVRKLYGDFEIVPVQAKRNINSKGTGRGNVGEVIVVYRGAAHRTAAPQEKKDLIDMLWP